MKRILNLYLLIALFLSLGLSQNIGAYLGAFPSASITSKKGDFSFNTNYTTFYSFNQNSDISHYKRLSLNVPLGGKGNWDRFEFNAGYTMGEENNYSEMLGLSYSFKKRKFGFGAHISSYNITINDVVEYSPMEYGASVHFRFRKKDVKPFFYYGYSDFGEDRDSYHTLIFGAVSRIDNMSISTHLVSSLDDLFNGEQQYSYLAVTLGFVID